MTDQTHFAPATVSLPSLTTAASKLAGVVRKLIVFETPLPVSKRNRRDIGLEPNLTRDDVRNHAIDIASRSGIPF